MYNHEDISESKKRIDEYKCAFNLVLNSDIFPAINTCLDNLGIDIERNKKCAITVSTYNKAIEYLSSIISPETKQEITKEEVEQAISLRNKNKQDKEDLERNLQELIELKKIGDLITKRDKLTEQLSQLMIKPNLDTEISNTQSKIDDLIEKVSIKKRLKSLSNTRSSKELQSLKIKALEKQSLLAKLSEINECDIEDNKDYTEEYLQEIQTAKKNKQELKNINKLLNGIPKTIEELNERIQILKDAKIAMNILHCPKCNANLIYSKNNLVVCDCKTNEGYDDEEMKRLVANTKNVYRYVELKDKLKDYVDNLDEIEKKVIKVIKARACKKEKAIIEEKLSKLSNVEDADKISAEYTKALEREMLIRKHNNIISLDIEALLNEEKKTLIELQQEKGAQSEREKTAKSLREEIANINRIVGKKGEGEH